MLEFKSMYIMHAITILYTTYYYPCNQVSEQTGFSLLKTVVCQTQQT